MVTRSMFEGRSVSATATLSVVGACALGLGCKPEFDERNSQVESARVLAIQSLPAEAAPCDSQCASQVGAAITYRALIVDATGELAAPTVDWRYCTEPKASSDLNDISANCFLDDGGPLTLPFASTGAIATSNLPVRACYQFGPNPPTIDQQPGRPADPDATGGYYQPVRLVVKYAGAEILAAGETRILCDLPDSSQQTNKTFRDSYRVNQNPLLASVLARTSTSPEGVVMSEDQELTVSPGERIQIEASWPLCPQTSVCGDAVCGTDETASGCPADCTTPTGCTGAETYLYYDLSTQTLLTQRESMRLSWFATAGSYRDERTGREQDDPAVTTENDWTAPASAGETTLWLVLHDSRGGVSWRTFHVTTR